MATEQYSIGYEEGYQAGWNAVMDSLQPAQQEPVAILNHAHGIHTVRSVKLNGLPDGEYNLYTSPQPAQTAQQEPVGEVSDHDWSTGILYRDLEPGAPLYTSPPAQQEPVATDWERIARVQDAKLRAMCNEAGGFEKLCEVMNKYERTTPPAQRKPLTPREIELIDGMIAVQLDHAARCDNIANRVMAEKQKGWDMERVELLRKLKGDA